MNGQTFSKLEKKLKNDDEASKRTAISRFYYAAFGSSREYLTEVLNESQYLSRKDIHSKVLKRFQDSLYPDENSIHPLLLKLRSERNKAIILSFMSLKILMHGKRIQRKY